MARAENGKAVFLIYKEGLTNNDSLKSAGLAGIRLPVAPLDTISIEQGINLNNSVVPLKGSVVFGGGPGLATVDFNSLLPIHQNESWAHLANAQYPYQDPTWYDGFMRKLASENVIFRLVVSEPVGAGAGYLNSGIGDNRLVFDSSAMVSAYNVTDEEGDCLYYSITFTEYKELTFTSVRKDIGPEFYTISKYNTLESVANYYRPFGVTWKNLLRLNRNMKQPVTKKRQKPKKVTNQKQKIKKGTKIRLRTSTGVIDSIDDFNVASRQGIESSVSG